MLTHDPQVKYINMRIFIEVNYALNFIKKLTGTYQQFTNGLKAHQFNFEVGNFRQF